MAIVAEHDEPDKISPQLRRELSIERILDFWTGRYDDARAVLENIKLRAQTLEEAKQWADAFLSTPARKVTR